MITLREAAEASRGTHDSDGEIHHTVDHSSTSVSKGATDAATWALRDSNPRPARCKRDALAN